MNQFDSLETDTAKVDFMYQKIFELKSQKPDEGLALLDSFVLFYEDRPSFKYQIEFLEYMYGLIYKSLGKLAMSEKYLKLYANEMSEQKKVRNIAQANMALSNLFTGQSKWGEAMEPTLESIKNSEILKDTLGVLRANSKLGLILSKLKRYDESMKKLQKSIKLARLKEDKTELSVAYNYIATLHEDKGQLDSAMVYYLKSSAISKELNNQWNLIYDLNNMSNLMIQKENYKEALTYALKCEEVAQKIDAPMLNAIAQNILGLCYLKMGETAKGRKILEAIITDTSYAELLQFKQTAHENLYENYSSTEEHEKALLNYSKMIDIRDTLFERENLSQINDLEFKYESDKKNSEIALLNLEKEVNEVKLSTSKKQNMILSLGFLILCFLTIFLYGLFKRNQKQKQAIEKANREKDTLLKEIHHRVKNNLQVISSLLALQGKYIHDNNALDALKRGQDRVQSMALLHQDLYQSDNLTGVNAQDYFEQLVENLFDSYNIMDESIQLDLDIKPIVLDVDTMIPLGLVINELVSNSLKHAFKEENNGVIRVKLSEIDSELILQVSDNGKGLQNLEDLNGKSFGYELIRSFAKKLKAEISINNEKGFDIQLRINNYKLAA